MFHKQQIADPKITQNVTQRLAGAGIRAPSKVTVSSRQGDVTLAGSIQYEHQRLNALQAARVNGVRRVIDQMRVLAPARRV